MPQAQLRPHSCGGRRGAPQAYAPVRAVLSAAEGGRGGGQSRILVVRLASLGDLLITTPALRALRTTFPEAHIGVLTTPASAPALRGLDTYDEVITFDKFAFDRPPDALRGLPAALGLSAELRAGEWQTL